MRTRQDTNTVGRWLLLQVLQMTTAREVATRLGLHESNVHRWADGENKPAEAHRKELARLYRIPAKAWEARRRVLTH